MAVAGPTEVDREIFVELTVEVPTALPEESAVTVATITTVFVIVEVVSAAKATAGSTARRMVEKRILRVGWVVWGCVVCFG